MLTQGQPVLELLKTAMCSSLLPASYSLYVLPVPLAQIVGGWGLLSKKQKKSGEVQLT